MIVFYSWQSWISTNVNRNFIQRAIEKASKKLEAEEKFLKLDYLLEKDTENVTGSPDIAETIFEKIRECDIFIGDVTPVAISTEGRKIPNPNVLVELGYAASELGWERIICVLNTAYGAIEQLPFDIRQHRITTYHVTENMNDEERAEQRKKLSAAIVASLRGVTARISPDLEYLNGLIRKQIYFIRVCVPVIIWVFEKSEDSEAENRFVYLLLQHLVSDAKSASEKQLPNLLLEKSHAFTSRQKKRCRELANVTGELAIRVGYVLMRWEMVNERQGESNNGTEHSLREYLTLAINVMKSLYESEWLTVFDNLDNKFVLTPDEFLFGKEPLSEEREREILEKLYKLEGHGFDSREEFDKAYAPTPEEERAYKEDEIKFDKMLAYYQIHSVYQDKELAKLVWKFIQTAKEPE